MFKTGHNSGEIDENGHCLLNNLAIFSNLKETFLPALRRLFSRIYIHFHR